MGCGASTVAIKESTVIAMERAKVAAADVADAARAKMRDVWLKGVPLCEGVVGAMAAAKHLDDALDQVQGPCKTLLIW